MWHMTTKSAQKRARLEYNDNNTNNEAVRRV